MSLSSMYSLCHLDQAQKARQVNMWAFSYIKAQGADTEGPSQPSQLLLVLGDFCERSTFLLRQSLLCLRLDLPGGRSYRVSLLPCPPLASLDHLVVS